MLGVFATAVCRWERTGRIHGVTFETVMRTIETAKAEKNDGMDT